ncbi:MAG: hypothetical protein NVSMB25_18970 [Thermoleophilaceae bacterium]
MTFTRLGRGEWIALVGALAVLLVLPLRWYSTHQAEQDRQNQHQFVPRLSVEVTPNLSTQAAQAAAALEKNAWQAGATVDRALLLGMLAAAALAIMAAFLRASGRTFAKGVSPSLLASGAAIVSAALIAYRIAVPPGGVAGVVKSGAFLGMLAVLGIGFGSYIATFKTGRNEVPGRNGVPDRNEVPV